MKDLILLHGALGCTTHWNHVLPLLDTSFRIHNLNFPLHGKTLSEQKNLTLDDLAVFVADYVAQHQLNSFFIAGYSMGGYVGLELAARNLKGFEKLITLGTKLNWSPDIAEKEIAGLSPERLEPIHGKLEAEHGEHWLDVVEATYSIMRSIGDNPLRKEQLSASRILVRLQVGEKDKMVSVVETISFCEGNKHISYEVLEAQPHLLERVDAALLARKINSFLTSGSAVR
jgi:pimeloyl-ACP methyl ester carboxylesterase